MKTSVSPNGMSFSLEFTPDIASYATAYQWGFNAHTPNNNVPNFPFTTPTQATSGVSDFHWYGHGSVDDDQYEDDNDVSGGEDDTSLRWTGNCMEICSYELWCTITMADVVTASAPLKAGAGSTGKYFYVDVDDAGKTTPCALVLLDKIAVEQDADGKWVITGIGELKRNAAYISDEAAKSSQFYDIVHTHESKHVSDYEEKDANGKYKYLNKDKFFADVNDQGWKESSEIALRNKIVVRHNAWVHEEANHPGPGTTGEEWMELRAYHSEYTVEPVGVRERSDTWIENKYNN